MSDPDIKSRFTPHILDITQALTRIEAEGGAMTDPVQGAIRAANDALEAEDGNRTYFSFPEMSRVAVEAALADLVDQDKVLVDVPDLVAAITVMVSQDDVCANPDCWRDDCQVPARLRAALPDASEPPENSAVTLHWEDPASPTGQTASPGWTETGTSGGSRILWKTADSGDLLITAAPTEVIHEAKPHAEDTKLLRQIADAIHYTLYGARGNDSTRKLATTAAHAVMSVRDLEVAELRRSLAISRKRTAHFAALYSEALDELEDPTP